MKKDIGVLTRREFLKLSAIAAATASTVFAAPEKESILEIPDHNIYVYFGQPEDITSRFVKENKGKPIFDKQGKHAMNLSKNERWFIGTFEDSTYDRQLFDVKGKRVYGIDAGTITSDVKDNGSVIHTASDPKSVTIEMPLRAMRITLKPKGHYGKWDPSQYALSGDGNMLYARSVDDHIVYDLNKSREVFKRPAKDGQVPLFHGINYDGSVILISAQSINKPQDINTFHRIDIKKGTDIDLGWEQTPGQICLSSDGNTCVYLPTKSNQIKYFINGKNANGTIKVPDAENDNRIFGVTQESDIITSFGRFRYANGHYNSK